MYFAWNACKALSQAMSMVFCNDNERTLPPAFVAESVCALELIVNMHKPMNGRLALRILLILFIAIFFNLE